MRSFRLFLLGQVCILRRLVPLILMWSMLCCYGVFDACALRWFRSLPCHCDSCADSSRDAWLSGWSNRFVARKDALAIPGVGIVLFPWLMMYHWPCWRVDRADSLVDEQARCLFSDHQLHDQNGMARTNQYIRSALCRDARKRSSWA